MKKRISPQTLVGVCVALAAVTAPNANAQYTPYWFDGFDVSAATSDINFEIGPPRQGGPLVPTSYVTANVGVDTWKHQMFGAGPLQLAGSAALHTLVSPDQNFTGTVGNEAIARKISVTMDALWQLAPNNYGLAAITIGSAATTQQHDTKADGFSVVFVEDTFSNGDGTGLGSFIQILDGNAIIDNGIANPAGSGPGNLELFIDDFSDGNPWDGSGSTTIGVSVNGTPIGSYTKGSGGYTANYITLEGSDQKVGAQLGVHTFDNLTVFTSPIPEPSTFALAGMGIVTLSLFRRRKG